MFDLSGRTALVTGASGGIGRAIAEVLHGQGARLVLAGTRAPALEALRAALGERAVVAVADLRAPGAADDLAAVAGPVDILVANAGISRRSALDATPDAEWDEVLDVNLSAVFRLTRRFAPEMAARGWGRIVAIGSILGTTGADGMGAYSASKAGLAALMKAVALEFAGRGVTANTIAPGYIRTPMMDMNPPEVQREILSRIPVGFFGAPADVAAAVLWLAAAEGRFVTGATIDLNGGMVMP